MKVKSYIALGANLGQPLETLPKALLAMHQLPQSELLSQSSFYRTQPLGSVQQPDFINAVALLETRLSAMELLKYLQGLEWHFGRRRGERWGPRTLDLDILLYGDKVIKSDTLTVPHPGLMQREFVLYPLAEIAPDLILPTGQSILKLKADCDPRGIRKIEMSEMA